MGVGVEHRLTLAGSGVELQLELTVCEGLRNFPNQRKQALQDHLIFQFTNVFGRGNASDHKAVLEAKQIFEIEHLSSKFTNELSSGELHLCAIAKAYVQQTDYILLDEPTSHLDYANKIKVYQILEKLAKTHNKGIIISTHDLDLTFKFPFNFYLIDSKHQRLKLIKDFKEVELEFKS